MNKEVRDRLIDELLSRNVEHIVGKEDLIKDLKTKKLRVKLGIDPTSGNIHLGRAIPLHKLKQFQNLGHKVVLVIGDFTAQIGDASDKDSERKPLSKKQIISNMKDYIDQIGLIIDLDQAEIHYNSQWLEGLKLDDVLELSDLFTVAQMTERDNFSKRIKANKPISLKEFMYPLMQGYDSVVLRADIELGGTDQLFNLHAGRVLQRHFGQKPQSLMTFGLLIGTDGRKMSSSWGNVINLKDSADEMFAKLMMVSDDNLKIYMDKCSSFSVDETNALVKEIENGANPRDIKLLLASNVTSIYHGVEHASRAHDKWVQRFSDKVISSDDMPSVALDYGSHMVIDLYSNLFKLSKSETRRLLSQKGLKHNGKILVSDTMVIQSKDILSIGKLRHFIVT
jgi:tyrosyl-tRNA synthetase